MNRLEKTEIEILKALYQKYKENPTCPFTSGEDLLRAGKLQMSEDEISAAINYLADSGMIEIKLRGFGMKYFQYLCSITSYGIDALREIDSPSQQNSGAPSIINNGVMLNSIIGNDNSVSITIDDSTIEKSFNSLRELLSSDESLKIISEMEEETKSKHPSLDKLLEMGKSLVHGIKDEVKAAVRPVLYSLFAALLLQVFTM